MRVASGGHGFSYLSVMMHPVPRLNTRGADPLRGRVRWDAGKSAWFGIHLALVAATLALVALGRLPGVGLGGTLALLALTWTLTLLGHSLGYHRLLMHGNFRARRWLGRTLLAAGAMLGTAGPRDIVAVHDIRDWAQRAPACHPYFSQHNGFLRDIWWQMACRLDLDAPPAHVFEHEPGGEPWLDDPFARHLDRWWRVWALAPLVPLALIGGWTFAVLGVSGRILAVNAGHWAVNHVCHDPRREVRGWSVPGHGVQASDLLAAGPVTGFLAGLLTVGECWHANHHAFPESANVGLGRHQFDPGYAILRLWERWGWVSHIRAARDERGDVVAHAPTV